MSDEFNFQLRSGQFLLIKLVGFCVFVLKYEEQPPPHPPPKKKQKSQMVSKI